MPTRITEIESRNQESDLEDRTLEHRAHHPDSADVITTSGKQPMLLKVEGTLYLKDAELLERICRDVFRQTSRPVVIDFSDLSFLDSDSAAVLCRMHREQGVSLDGLNLFIKKVVELAEESEKVRRYLPDR